MVNGMVSRSEPFRFATPRAFAAWLRKNHASSDGVWLLIAKAGADEPTVTYPHAVEIALCYGKGDGRWQAAYDGARSAVVPADLQAALDARPEARSFFAQLDGANRYAVLWRIQTARRPETRSRRIDALVEMLARGEKIHG